MAGQTLTPKQEAFAQAYVETGNASEAYRRAYDAENMQPQTIAVKASELLASGKVSVRVAELRDAHLARHNLTVDDIKRMLLEDRQFARECTTPAAAVSASMGLAKLYGHLTERVELGVTNELAAIIAARRAKVADLNGGSNGE